MKTKCKLLLCVLLACAPIAFSGMTCKPSEQRLAYNTLSSVEDTTTAAFRAYLTLVVKGEVSKDKLPAVAQAYNQFQSAMQAAVVMLGTPTAPATVEVVTAAANVVSEIGKARKP